VRFPRQVADRSGDERRGEGGAYCERDVHREPR